MSSLDTVRGPQTPCFAFGEPANSVRACLRDGSEAPCGDRERHDQNLDRRKAFCPSPHSALLRSLIWQYTYRQNLGPAEPPICSPSVFCLPQQHGPRLSDRNPYAGTVLRATAIAPSFHRKQLKEESVPLMGSQLIRATIPGTRHMACQHTGPANTSRTTGSDMGPAVIAASAGGDGQSCGEPGDPSPCDQRPGLQRFSGEHSRADRV